MTTVGSKVLDAAIGLVIHAAAKDQSRPMLAVVLFEGDAKGLRLVTADNYRIAVADISDEDHSAFGRVALSTDGVPTLRAFLKIWDRPTDVTKSGSVLTFGDETQSVSLRIVDGTFPDYASVISFDGPTYGINPDFFLDSARATKGRVLRIAKDASLTSPFIIQAEGYREAIMPVRLEEDWP